MYIRTTSSHEVAETKVQTFIEIENSKFKNNSASSGSSILLYEELWTELYIDKFNNISIKEDQVDVGVIRYLGENGYEKLENISFKSKNNILNIEQEIE